MRDLLDTGNVATCGPVVAELLAGTNGVVAERMWEMLSSLRWAELDAAGWRQVGLTAQQLRIAGTVLPLTDLTIAVASVRARYHLWSFDGDFDRIAPTLEGFELYDPALIRR
jgi:predicted nucleic acid-binding protein